MNPIERFLTAARGGTVDRPPVWLMRQAGRYLPEYQAIRASHSFLEMCKTPELAAEVSLQPLRRYGMDAVIFFCDILIPCEAMGLPLLYNDTTGPKLGPLAHTMDAVNALTIPDPKKTMPFVGETLTRLRESIKDDAILIGFGGAPWTLATYALAGGSTNDRSKVKDLLSLNPKLLHSLMEKLTDTSIAYLNNQIDSGAQAIQLFDSWAGQLTPTEYTEIALPYTKRVLAGIRRKDVPLILFGQKSAHLLPLMDTAGADVVSVGDDTTLSDARSVLKNTRAIQGNLSPDLLRDGPVEKIVSATQDMLSAGGRTGYIANLGHGVFKQTPPDHVAAFVKTVQLFESK